MQEHTPLSSCWHMLAPAGSHPPQFCNSLSNAFCLFFHSFGSLLTVITQMLPFVGCSASEVTGGWGCSTPNPGLNSLRASLWFGVPHPRRQAFFRSCGPPHPPPSPPAHRTGHWAPQRGWLFVCARCPEVCAAQEDGLHGDQGLAGMARRGSIAASVQTGPPPPPFAQ